MPLTRAWHGSGSGTFFLGDAEERLLRCEVVAPHELGLQVWVPGGVVYDLTPDSSPHLETPGPFCAMPARGLQRGPPQGGAFRWTLRGTVDLVF